MNKFDDALARQLTAQLYLAVGGFFCNTQRLAPGICRVCTGPATTEPPLCDQCRSARAVHGSSLADLVVPLAYAKGWMPYYHQSAHHVRLYKAPTPASKCVQDLLLMASAAIYLHGECVRTVVAAWQAVTFVPSSHRPGGTHPIATIARQVHGVGPPAVLLHLDIGPGFGAPPFRAPRADRFVVPAQYRPHVANRHVLLVEDTWVSGDKAQSAAIALKTAGAARVTVLCLTRWLSYKWPPDRELIDTLADPYDATRCPVTGSSCP